MRQLRSAVPPLPLLLVKIRCIGSRHFCRPALAGLSSRARMKSSEVCWHPVKPKPNNSGRLQHDCARGSTQHKTEPHKLGGVESRNSSYPSNNHAQNFSTWADLLRQWLSLQQLRTAASKSAPRTTAQPLCLQELLEQQKVDMNGYRAREIRAPVKLNAIAHGSTRSGWRPLSSESSTWRPCCCRATVRGMGHKNSRMSLPVAVSSLPSRKIRSGSRKSLQVTRPPGEPGPSVVSALSP